MPTLRPSGDERAQCRRDLWSSFYGAKSRSSRCRCDPAAQPCRELTANSTQSPTSLGLAGFH